MSLLKSAYARLPQIVHTWIDITRSVGSSHPRTCTICGYHGRFHPYGRPLRPDARCPKCTSLERHRLLWHWYGGDTAKLAEPILHFAPDPFLSKEFRKQYTDYVTADLFAPADLALDIEAIDLPDRCMRTVICSHVLEHVDDAKALAEIRRILTDDGLAIIAVPIAHARETTYENPAVRTAKERELHFGQSDHVRYYGRDVRDRLRKAGFTFEEVAADGRMVAEHALLAEDIFFLCRKS
jgi:SAM-dependent methyltransferase